MNRGFIEGENFRLALLLLNRALRIICRFDLQVFSGCWSLFSSERCRLAGLGFLRFLRRYSLLMHEYLILKLLRLLLAIDRRLIRYLILNGRLYLNTEFLKFEYRRGALQPIRSQEALLG